MELTEASKRIIKQFMQEKSNDKVFYCRICGHITQERNEMDSQRKNLCKQCKSAIMMDRYYDNKNK